PVRYASVNDLGVLLRPFVSSRGTLVANRETNVLIITDAASNIRRVLDIVKLVDVQVSLDERQTFPISFADACEVATILNQLFAGGRLRAAGTPGVPGVPTPTPGAAAPGPAGATAADRPPLVIAEKRSNSIIVHGRKNEIEMIRRILSQLDINVTGGRRADGRPRRQDAGHGVHRGAGGEDHPKRRLAARDRPGAPERPPRLDPPLPGGAAVDHDVLDDHAGDQHADRLRSLHDRRRHR